MSAMSEEEVLVPLMGTSASVHSSWRAEVQERLGRASTATSECSVDNRYTITVSKQIYLQLCLDISILSILS